ncbi:hypothetical protein B0H13DRAFT_1978624 [Mycena leptocephala]|nr:hypothetical protein B0H13DRAFT_1978624 [Mycena leptocephala]
MTRTVKLAVVGSGLAGLTAAHLLVSSRLDTDVEFDVHLFEKVRYIYSGDSRVYITQTATLDKSPGYYPHLIALYTKLGVAFRQADFSYSFSRFSQSEKTQPLRTTMIYNGASGRDGVGMPAWMQDLHLYQKGHHIVMRAFALGLFILSTVQLFVCYMRLISFALPSNTVPSNVVARLLRFDTMWKSFTQDVLIPLFSAVCTAPREAVNVHPVEDFLDYIWLTFGTHHYVVVKGVRDAVARLTVNVKNIHLSSRLVGASRVGPLLSSYAASLPPDAPARHAVMAQIQCLEEFHYIRTIVINHTDASSALLPPTRATARPQPHHRRTILAPPPALKAELAVPVFQTTNPFVPVHDDRILSVATLERAVLTMPAKTRCGAWWQSAAEAECTLGELQGAGRRESDAGPGVWLCGSYAYVGIPLLEGCVVSARNVYRGICESEGVRPGSASLF